VLHVYKDIHPEVPGGIERHIDDLRRHMPEVVSDVLIAARGCRATRSRSLPAGREVAVWQVGRVLSTPLTGGYPRWIRRLKPDVLHLHMPNPPAELSVLTVPGDLPLVVSYHADVVRQAKLLRAYSVLIRRVLDRADVVISGSQSLLRTSAFVKRVADKTVVIPYGVDMGQFDRSKVAPEEILALTCPEGRRTVVAVGRLVHYKGFDRLIDLAGRIDGRLIIVGGGPLEASLRERAAGHPNVSLTGPVSDRALRAHLAAADVFVLPSVNRAESFGIATIEAQAMGLAAVVTDVGTGTVEAVEDGVTGYVVPSAHDEALVGRINLLLGDDELRSKMGDAARRRVVERFDVHQSVSSHLRIYRSLALR
jgi:rhamnosyl/mannosyltransferase